MGASLKVKVDDLLGLATRFMSPALKQQISRFPEDKGVAALVGQAIADNFNQEGPGWAPLKPETIRRSVSKKLQKKLAGMTDEELLAHERKARAKNAKQVPHRAILRRTGLLMKAATTPNANGNIWRQEGTNLIWGVNLKYAAVHNYGYPKKKIPKREYLVLRAEWVQKLQQYVVTRFGAMLVETLRGMR